MLDPKDFNEEQFLKMTPEERHLFAAQLEAAKVHTEEQLMNWLLSQKPGNSKSALPNDKVCLILTHEIYAIIRNCVGDCVKRHYINEQLENHFNL